MSDDGDDPTPADRRRDAAAEPAAAAAAVAVDPRMRSRRIAVRRDGGTPAAQAGDAGAGPAGPRGPRRRRAAVAGARRRPGAGDRDRAHAPDAVRREAGVELGDALVGIDPGRSPTGSRRCRGWPRPGSPARGPPPSASRSASGKRRRWCRSPGSRRPHRRRGPLVSIERRRRAHRRWGRRRRPASDGGVAAGALVLTGIEGPIAEGRRLDGDARDALDGRRRGGRADARRRDARCRPTSNAGAGRRAASCASDRPTISTRRSPR